MDLRFLFVQRLDDDHGTGEECQRGHPQDDAAEHAAESCAQTADHVCNSGDAGHQACVGQLGIDVIHVVALGTGGGEDGGVGDGGNMVTEHSTAQSSGNGEDGQSAAAASLPEIRK